MNKQTMGVIGSSNIDMSIRLKRFPVRASAFSVASFCPPRGQPNGCDRMASDW
jgi:hypothetical protein